MLELFKKQIQQEYINLNDTSDKKRHSFSLKIIIIIITILACAFFYYFNFSTVTNENKDLKLETGYTWTAPSIIADYNFSIYKPDFEYRAEVQNTKDSAQIVFILDPFAEQNTIERISVFLQQLAINSDKLLTEYIPRDKLVAFNTLDENIKKKEISKLQNLILPYIRNIYQYGYTNIPIEKIISNDAVKIKLNSDKEYYLNKSTLIDKQKLSVNLQTYTSDIYHPTINSFLAEFLYKIIQPNLIFSDELTKRSANLAATTVKKTIGIVRKGETIIEKGEQLNSDNIAKIRSYYINTAIQEQHNYTILNILGSIGHVTMAYSIFLIFLIIIRKKIWLDNYHLIMINLMLVSTCILGWLSFQYELVYSHIPIEYLVILPAFSMFIAIVFDSRTAFYATVSMSLLLAGVRGNDYYIGITMLFTGTIAAYSVRDIQDRWQIFSGVIFIFVGFTFSIFSVSFERGFDFSKIMPQLLFALINAIIAPVITFIGVLSLNKYTRYLTTDIKIKEYDDEKNPLLQEMKLKAPGSYEHSLEVANLTKKCAEAIGASALLARVGALYHDIGKINNAEYFTENKEQYIFVDKHSFLPPKKSAAMIKAHVALGIENAIKHRLPQQIIDFIPMHHGTSLIKHFYNVAVNESEQTGTIVDEKDFRYPGPKPQTKETVILMICDSAEAISKSATDIKKFEEIFNQNIEDRFFDGQFDEADISLKDIYQVRTTVLNEIKAKMHTRTQYAVIKKETNSEEHDN